MASLIAPDFRRSIVSVRSPSAWAGRLMECTRIAKACISSWLTVRFPFSGALPAADWAMMGKPLVNDDVREGLGLVHAGMKYLVKDVVLGHCRAFVSG